MKKFEQMAGTRKFIIKMLLSIQEDEEDSISLEEFNSYDNEQLTEEFLSAGFVDNERAFAGVFDEIPKGYIDIKLIGDVTGWPASIDDYYESPNPLMSDDAKLGKRL